MKKALFCILTIFLSIAAEAQTGCTSTMSCKVIAPSGMRMRSEASLKSAVVTYVPKDSLLSACTDKFGAMSYEDINGFWRKVQYNGKQGFMFDGFLEIIAIKSTEVKAEPKKTVAVDSIFWANPDDSLGIDSITVLKPSKASIDSADRLLLIDTTSIKSFQPQVEQIIKKVEKFSILTEAYNYCGDVQSINPGLVWYGIYPKDRETDNYRIRKVEVNIILSKDKIGKGLEFDIQTDQSERSIFLLGVSKILSSVQEAQITDVSEILRFNNRKVFPGQQWNLNDDPQNIISLSATGSVVTAGPCPDLENYKLSLKGEKYFLPINQNLSEEIVSPGQCGMPEIYWYGDLNGDQVPEIIFVSVYEDKNQFTLFVSDPKAENLLVKKETEWVISNCN